MITLRLRYSAVVLAFLALLALPSASSHPLAAGEIEEARAKIVALIRETWDTPQSRIEVEPVVIAGHHAIADWVHGEHGGRALLREENGVWLVILCSGDPLKEAENLIAAGVPPEEAARLARDLAAEEAELPPERRAAFSSFEGTVQMGGHPKHP